MNLWSGAGRAGVTKDSLMIVVGTTTISYTVVLIEFLTNIAAISIISSSKCPQFCSAHFFFCGKLHLESRPQPTGHRDMYSTVKSAFSFKLFISIATVTWLTVFSTLTFSCGFARDQSRTWNNWMFWWLLSYSEVNRVNQRVIAILGAILNAVFNSSWIHGVFSMLL